MNILRTTAARSVRPSSVAAHARTYAAGATPPEWDKPYPELPNVSHQRRPARGWWDMQLRRNLGETMHEREELHSMWGPDVPHVEPKTALRHFLIASAGFVAFALACKTILLPDLPAVRREYPHDGLVKEMGGLGDNAQRTESVEEEE